jgi:2'-5' RNA ligase
MRYQYSLFDEGHQGAVAATVEPVRAVDGAATRVHSLFFALLPDAADATRLHAHARRLEQGLGRAGQPLEAERLHVSLHALGAHVGDDRWDVDLACWRRAAAAVRVAPFDVVFDRFMSFSSDGHPRVFTSSDDAGLQALHEALGIALANTGERLARRRITPHMTVSYRAARVAERPVEPLRWRASTLVLVDSHFGEHVHEVLGRWPLQG